MKRFNIMALLKAVEDARSMGVGVEICRYYIGESCYTGVKFYEEFDARRRVGNRDGFFLTVNRCMTPAESASRMESDKELEEGMARAIEKLRALGGGENINFEEEGFSFLKSK